MISIHPTSEVNAKFIGENTLIWQFCIILEKAKIGKNCNINCHVFIENDVVIGDNVTIKPCVQIWDGLRIGNNVFIGPNVTFTNDLLPRSKVFPEIFLKTTIEDGVSIGANSTILAGRVIGEFSMIGAGSVVTKDVPAFSLCYGNPASCKGFITREGQLLTKDLIDKYGRKYIFKDNEPILL